MWLNICQGLVIVGLLIRLITLVKTAALGSDKVEASGAFGIFVSILWWGFIVVITVRAGAISTIIELP